MAVDKRTDELMGHVESMLDIIDDMTEDMQSRIKKEEAKENPDESRIHFYQSQLTRLVKLNGLLEDDILEVMISIRNISGPIEYME